MIQGSALANEFHVRFALARKFVQKAHTTFQPSHKPDVLETGCEVLHRGILTLGLVVVVVTHRSALCAKVSVRLAGPIKLELASEWPGALDFESLSGLLGGAFHQF